MTRHFDCGRARLGVVALFGVLCAAASTHAQAPVRAQDRELLQSLRERRDAAVRREAQLLEARIRLDLGLEVRDSLFEPTAAEREVARFEGQERLDAERAVVARLGRRRVELEEQVAVVRAGRERAARQDFVLVESQVPERSELEELVARARAASAAQRAAERSAGDPELAVDADPEAATPVDPLARDSRPAVFVQGAGDASALGFALLRAGNLLGRDAERASRDGDAARAADLAGAATKRFEDARASFESLRQQELATVRELFGLACALERLGDLVAADSRYVEVMALDQETAPDGTVGYGPWGRAAQTARTVMHWIDDNRGWRPRRDPDEIPLPLR